MKRRMVNKALRTSLVRMFIKHGSIDKRRARKWASQLFDEGKLCGGPTTK